MRHRSTQRSSRPCPARRSIATGWPLLALAAGCQLDLDGAPCPCATGWTCCVGSEICVQEPVSCPATDGKLVIEPAAAMVPSGQLQGFAASEPVTWRVHEADGGAIDADGVYEAPPAPGSYTIIATSVADPRRFDLAQVAVAHWRADLAAGALGGPGDLDGGAASARFARPQKIVAAADKVTLYIADCDNNTIRRLVRSGAVATVAGRSPRHSGVLGGDDSAGFVDGTAGDARFRCPTGLALDEAAGLLYVADRQNGSVRQVALASGAVTRIAGDPANGYQVLDGIGAAASFGDPAALALDGHGHLYVAETTTRVLRRIDLATAEVTTVAGARTTAPGDGIGAAAGWSWPSGLAWDPSGVLYVADLDAIRRFDPTSAAVTTIAGALGARQVKDGTGAEARFDAATDLTLDGMGSVLVTERGGGGLIRSLDLASLAVTTWVGGSSTALGSVDGPLATARIRDPRGITALTTIPFHVFVADDAVPAIRGIYRTGMIQTDGGALPLVTDGRSAMAGDGPLTVDGAGHAFTWHDGAVYVAAGTGAPLRSGVAAPGVLAVAPDGTALYLVQGHAVFVSTVGYPASAAQPVLGPPVLVAGDLAHPGALDDAGPAARFDQPQGLALDAAGSLFVTDRGNHTVRRIELSTGRVTTLAGAPGEAGSDDGTGSTARLRGPAAVLYLPGDPARLYVADADDHTVRAIDPATGAVTTPLGAAGTPGLRDGVGGEARFDHPAALAADAAGNLYVRDATTVRRVEPRSRTVRTFAGTQARGVVLGALPASLNQPAGIAVNPDGSLWIANIGEPALVLAHPE
jgi:DNA-binding beta-propeller fold protein YncE